jgi:hypothetical protein
MTSSTLGARLAEILDGGGGEPAPGLAETHILLLVTLDSGARLGLDREARWVLVFDDGRPSARFAPRDAHLFHEPIEWKRRRFDDAVEEAAGRHGLDALAVVDAFPAVEVIRAVLAKDHPYLTRLALEWLRPTELRELRAEIRKVTVTDTMPVAVKDLAERLIVPE